MYSKKPLFSEELEHCLVLSDVRVLQLDDVSESGHHDFLNRYTSHFQQINPIYELLNKAIAKKSTVILQWIEINCLPFLKQFPPKLAKSSLARSWNKDFMDAVDFCYKHLQESLNVVEETNHVHKPGSMRYGGLDKKEKLPFYYSPEMAVYFHLVKYRGWRTAFRIKQTRWKEYLQKEVHSHLAIEITQAMWQRGTVESIRFCYEHFGEKLRYPGISGSWIIETAFLRVAQSDLLIEAFLKSGVTDRFVCNGNLDLYTLASFLEKYLLLQTCSYSGYLASNYKAFKKEMNPEKKSHNLFHDVEMHTQRNKDILTCHRAFLKICTCIIILKSNLLPELALNIAFMMFETTKIRPVFGFFKAYERQSQQAQEYADISLQSGETRTDPWQLNLDF